MNSKKRNELRERIRVLEGLTAEERTALLGLLAESKPYGLVWEDKPEDVEERLRNELPVLHELPERALISPDPEAPNHILIEGDNIEALSTLAYTHEGKIDVIYIDPPYNTGNKDFVYNDSYVEKEDAYRHSKWLSFMAKRLRIAKTLMSERGVIFISIDDNEQAQLKLLCDEVFGEGNFVGQIMWHKNYASANDTNTIASVLDYILVYSKTRCFTRNLLPRTDKQNVLYKYDSNDGKGRWRPDNLSVRTYSANYDYPITNPNTGKTYNPPKGRSWMTNKEKVEEWIKSTRVYFGLKGNGAPQLKRYLEEVQQGVVPTTYWSYEDCGHNDEARKELKDIFGHPPFTSPKPTRLLEQILRVGSSINSTILDFFAGSGTTLHAVMQLNAEDGGHRQCILVTNNENGICEKVTYERNRRVIEGYTTPKGEVRAGLRGNTLRYYRTDFIPRSRTVKNMRQLVNLSTDMLCVKENIYREEATFGGVTTRKGVFRYFREGERQMLVVYREEVVEELAELIYDMEVAEPIIVYVFSPSEDAWSDEWDDVQEKVRPTALPAAILNTYKRVLPKRRDTPLETNQEEEGA